MDVVLTVTSNATDTRTLILMGVSIAAVLYFTFRKKRKRDPLGNLPFRTSMQQQKALERDMQNVVVELSEMTRQMTAQLETRAAKLDLLIQEADAKIVKLDAALAAVNGQAIPAPDAIDQPAKPPAKTPAKPAGPSMRLVTDTEDRWSEIYALADQGLSTSQIARQLNRPEGEVDLILHLRPKELEPVQVEVSEPPSIVSAG